MPDSFPTILSSRIFKFIVGEEVDGWPTEFFVHENAIAQLSKPLFTLTKGELSEARTGCVIWKDISKETFERFVQFAYTGDYSIPKTENRNAVAKREKTELSAPTSPRAPNGIHKHRNSLESVDTSTAEPHGNSLPVNTNGVHPEASPENDDAATTILPASKKNKKKKKGKTGVAKEEAPLANSEPEPGLPEPTKPEEAVEPTKLVEPEQQSAISQPQTTEPEPPISPEETPPPPPESDLELATVTTQEKLSEQPSHTLNVDFDSLMFPLLVPRDNYSGTCEPVADFQKDHSYSNVLLSHASLYVLGDFQLIDSLKALSLFKLHKTLCTFQLNNDNVGDITDLARYAYSEEGKGFDEGIGQLRGLVCQYLAIHAMELSLDARFMNLLAEGGQIVKDFFKFQLQKKH